MQVDGVEKPLTRLIHTGSVIVDLVLEVPHLPHRGGDVLASSSQFVVGGGLNVLTAAQRDGLEAVFAGRRGTGAFGAMIDRALSDQGIVTALPPIADLDSGYSVVLVDPTTERTFVTYPGAEQLLSSQDLAAVLVRDDDIVYATGYSLSSTDRGKPVAGWLAALPEGPVVVFDPGPLVGGLDADLLRMVMSRVDVLSCNAREATISTGFNDPAEAALALLAGLRPGSAVLVREGP
ncbi:MAG TPA: PfkB family carbohydrate kinase, partial [Mycobacterium sp.]